MKIEKLSGAHFASIEYKRFYTKTKSGYEFDLELMVNKINELIELMNAQLELNEKILTSQSITVIDIKNIEKKIENENKLLGTFKQEGKCFSYCDRFTNEECDCLLGKENKKQHNTEILPCPFCGSKALIERTEIGNEDITEEFWISCSNEECMASELNFFWKSRADAIQAWNQRS